MRNRVVSRRLFWSAALVSSLLGGCIRQREAFVPVSQVPVFHSGMPAARYELPGGLVLLATVPLSDGLPKSELGALVGVRLFVRNESDAAPWQVDTREQTVLFSGQTQAARPAIVKNRQNSAVVTIAHGHRETIDLFFALPPPAAPDLPPPTELNVTWRIVAGTEPIVHQTAMFRARLTPVSGLKSDYGETMGQRWFNPAWGVSTPFYPPLVTEWHIIGPAR
jgi:hypothetical protein